MTRQARMAALLWMVGLGGCGTDGAAQSAPASDNNPGPVLDGGTVTDAAGQPDARSTNPMTTNPMTNPMTSSGRDGGGGDGDGGIPSVVASCVPVRCADLGLDCGTISNLCGGVVDCGTCSNGLTCGGDGRSHVCGAPSCVPTTCADEGVECGMIPDGCGHALDCLGCGAGQICSDGLCGNAPCVAASCRPGIDCDQISDGCGHLLDCGGCGGGQSCGAGGHPNVCGDCVPQCAGKICGSNGCGGECGSCATNYDCTSLQTKCECDALAEQLYQFQYQTGVFTGGLPGGSLVELTMTQLADDGTPRTGIYTSATFDLSDDSTTGNQQLFGCAPALLITRSYQLVDQDGSHLVRCSYGPEKVYSSGPILIPEPIMNSDHKGCSAPPL